MAVDGGGGADRAEVAEDLNGFPNKCFCKKIFVLKK